MKKIICAFLLCALAFSIFISCKKEPESPLEGAVYKAPTYTASVLEGTYLVEDTGYSFFSFGDYYWISFFDDGTLLASPAEGLTGAINEYCVRGTWIIEGNQMKISAYGKSYTGTKVNAFEKGGFAIKKSNYDGLIFAKISDQQISHQYINGIWFKSDDYGRNYGYEFSNGICYIYNKDGTEQKTTYSLSEYGTKILIGDSLELNIAPLSGYMLIGGSVFQKLY